MSNIITSTKKKIILEPEKQIITQSQFAMSTLMLKGTPFNFDLHGPFRDIYDWPKKRILLKTARQVGKSTFLSAFALTHSARHKHKRTFYASTSEKQAREFARVKLNEFLHRSPRIRPFLLNDAQGEVNDSVFEKQFSNGSGITVSYMKDDADRTRGYSADLLMLDEVQDMDHTQMPVVEEILSASMTPMRFYTGTPKTMDNHIEHKWNQSTKHEVFFKCKSCNKFNSIGYKNIGKKGPVCASCGGYLDITRHVWVPTYDKTGPTPYYLGARLPQPALLLHTSTQEKWEDLIYKYETYDEGKFINEVLGISHSTGKRLLTQDDIVEHSTGEATIVGMPNERIFRMFDMFVMGIDWTGDGVSNVSKNAVVVYGRRAGDPAYKAQVVYKRIFPRQDLMKTIEEIVVVARMFKVRVVGADAGEGALNNAYLAEALGANRVQPFRYGAYDLPARLSKDMRTVYLDKTQAVDDFFMHFKKGQFILPPFETFTEESEHLLAEYEVTTKSGRKIWTHSPSIPDDFLHAMIFGYNAYKMAMGSLKFY